MDRNQGAGGPEDRTEPAEKSHRRAGVKDAGVIWKIRLVCVALVVICIILSIRNVSGDFRSLFVSESVTFNAVTVPSAVLLVWAAMRCFRNYRSIREMGFLTGFRSLMSAGIVLYPVVNIIMGTISCLSADDSSFLKWIAATFGAMIMHLSSYIFAMTVVSAAGSLAGVIIHKNAILIDPVTVDLDQATTRDDIQDSIFRQMERERFERVAAEDAAAYAEGADEDAAAYAEGADEDTAAYAEGADEDAAAYAEGADEDTAVNDEGAAAHAPDVNADPENFFSVPGDL